MRVKVYPGSILKLTRASGDAEPILLTVSADVIIEEGAWTLAPEVPDEPPPVLQPSPDGTRGVMVIDNSGALWTLDGRRTMRNGVHVGAGEATEYFKGERVYARFADGLWYWWVDAWVPAPHDPTRPAIVTPPPPPHPPPDPPIPPTPPVVGEGVAAVGSIAAGSNQLKIGGANGDLG